MSNTLQPQVYANPASDFVFKKIMGNPVVAIDIINTFIPNLHVKAITYLPTIADKSTIDGRTTIVDVLAEDQDKNLFIIEMQNSGHRFFMERTVVYASRAIAHHKMVKKSENEEPERESYLNYNIKGTYVIAFIKNNVNAIGLSNGFDAPIATFYTTNIETGEKLSGAPEYYFILLSNVPKYLEKLPDDKKKWLYLLNSSADMVDVPSEYENDKSVQAYFLESRLANYTAEQLIQYQASMDTIFDIENAIIEAEIRGEAKGHAEGLETGRNEERYRMAKSCKEKGYPTSDIVEITGLSIDEISQL